MPRSKGLCYFAEERFDQVEPGPVFGREGECKAVRQRPEESPRLFGKVRGVIVEYETDAWESASS